jgi:hypothetical protein
MKCSNEHCTQFYAEIVHKISSGLISTENTTSTTYYGKRKDSTISFREMFYKTHTLKSCGYSTTLLLIRKSEKK